MSAFVIKLIAVITMLIDHTFACFRSTGLSNIRIGPGNGMQLYLLGREIGRIAFPIYCFMIVEGVKHTRNWKKYALRLALLAFLSEIPFDFGLHGLKLFPMESGWYANAVSSIDWKHQNVFFTLLFGMLAVQAKRSARKAVLAFEKKECPVWASYSLTAIRLAGYALLVCVLGWTAKNLLHTDYGMGGVVMIAVMGLCDEDWAGHFPWLPAWIVRTAVCFAALWCCSRILNSTIELYGCAALLPIALYNGKKGPSSAAVKQGFYLFYPLHLIVLGIVKAVLVG